VLINAKSFTIDGEAVVVGPDGLSRFEELSRREAARTAILYAFDLIEHDGEDLRNRPFLERKAALARLLRETEAGILLTNTSPRMGRPCSSPCASATPVTSAAFSIPAASYCRSAYPASDSTISRLPQPSRSLEFADQPQAG
jgi:hypothetical protein